MLRALRSDGAASRAELAQRTGLAKATVGVIVASRGRRRAGGGAEPPGAPRPPGRPVALVGDRYVALGLELNVDYVAAVVLDLAGAVRHGDPTGRGRRRWPATALATPARRIARDADRELVGAVVAVPGLVRGDDRTVAWAPNVDIDGDRVADAGRAARWAAAARCTSATTPTARRTPKRTTGPRPTVVPCST